MKPDPERPELALCVDVLAPEGYGEIIGGSAAHRRLRPAAPADQGAQPAAGGVRVVPRPAPLRHGAARRLRHGHRARRRRGSAGWITSARRSRTRGCSTGCIREDRLRLPRLPEEPRRLRGHAGPRPRRPATRSRPTPPTPTCSSSTPARSSTRPSRSRSTRSSRWPRTRRAGRCRRLVVTGCLAERYRDELQRQIPEIDAVLGTGEVPAIVAALIERPAARRRRRPAADPLDPPRAPARDRHATSTTPTRPATLDDAAALRLRQGRRRLRLHVRVLHHPDAARPLPQPAGRLDRRARPGRSPPAASGRLLLISQDTTFYGVDRGERGALARLLAAS